MLFLVTILFCLTFLDAKKRRPFRCRQENISASASHIICPPIKPREDFPISLNSCLVDLPSSLSFVESLNSTILPHEIVIFSGLDDRNKRVQGYGRISADSLRAFSKKHGYTLIFLDELFYDRNLSFDGTKFVARWNKIFALEYLRDAFPRAKYFVWIDDGVLVPYAETDMLNHYINRMESDDQCVILLGDDALNRVLNTSMFFMKNDFLSFEFFKRSKQIGTDEGGRLAKEFGFEAEALAIVRERGRLFNSIKVIKRRDEPFNFNTFVRNSGWDDPESLARVGDAFVNFIDKKPAERLSGMLQLLLQVREWRGKIPPSCSYPIETRKPGNLARLS